MRTENLTTETRRRTFVFGEAALISTGLDSIVVAEMKFLRAQGVLDFRPALAPVEQNMTRAQTTFFLLLIVIALALPPATVAQNDGASLYKLHCVKCHGENGTAKTAAAQKMKVANLLSDEVQKQSDDQLFDSIARGTRHKEYPHAFKYRGLSDSQIRKLVAYIRELPKTTK